VVEVGTPSEGRATVESQANRCRAEVSPSGRRETTIPHEHFADILRRIDRLGSRPAPA
jgi:hypothetical protein